ncbi:phage protease [Zhihengliuella halotolerans]|uniref:phage protease n=1 Tax=Zhihengliuella halotolerans TaxID=370736 RepID=UPI000C7FF5D1|nr:phage protease [Zhihengliuella halotolerans]
MAKTTYTTVTGVPLIRTGTWNASTGETTVTKEHLEQAVEASASELLDNAVIKLGHVDDRFDNPDWFDLDGEPAYGQITNLRVEDDEEGSVLLGDFINIPEDLADKMESAYPYRSVELNFDIELVDDTGKVKASFPVVLTAVALLGAAAPAVSGLGAVHEAFTKVAKGGKIAAARYTSHFALAGTHTYGSLRTALEQGIRSGLADDVYSWVRDFDDDHVVYEIESRTDMRLLRRGYTIAEDGAVSLSEEAEEVYERRVFEPIADTKPVPHSLSGARESERVKPSSVAAKAPSSHSRKKEADMATLTEEQVKKLRTAMGVSDEITDEEILAALDDTDPTPDAPVEPAEEPAPVAEAPEPVAASAGLPETVQVSAAAFTQLQQSNASMAARLAKVEAAEAAKRRDGIIKAAFAAGRLHPAEEAAFRSALERDEQGTQSLLEARHPVFPTQELGSANAAFALNGTDAVSQAQQATDDKIFGKVGK